MTLAEAQSYLASAKSAYTAAQAAYSATHGDKTIIYHKLETARNDVIFWEREVAALTASANGSTRPGVRIATWR